MFFQHGNEAASVADLKIADQLYHYMVGGQTKPQVGSRSLTAHCRKYQIRLFKNVKNKTKQKHKEGLTIFEFNLEFEFSSIYTI